MKLLFKIVFAISLTLASFRIQSQVLNSETTKILNIEIIRLNLDPITSINSFEKFAFRTAWIESEWDLEASNNESSARGMYQFTNDSLYTALNRLSRYYNVKPSWIHSVEQSGDITKMTADQQTALFFANLFRRKGTDPYLILIAKNNVWAMHQVYARFHHTSVDDATKVRMIKYYR